MFNIINISRKGLYDALTGCLRATSSASGSTTPSKRCRAGYSGSSSSTWTTLRPSTTISGMRRAIRPSGASPRPSKNSRTPLRAGLPLRGRRIRPVHPAGHTFRCFRPSPGTPRNPAREHRRERCGLCLRYEHRGSVSTRFPAHSTKPSTWRTRLCTPQTERQGNVHLPSLPCGMALIPSLAGIAAFPSRKASCTAS